MVFDRNIREETKLTEKDKIKLLSAPEEPKAKDSLQQKVEDRLHKRPGMFYAEITFINVIQIQMSVLDVAPTTLECICKGIYIVCGETPTGLLVATGVAITPKAPALFGTMEIPNIKIINVMELEGLPVLPVEVNPDGNISH